MVLVCKDRRGAESILDALEEYADPAAQTRLVRMHGRGRTTREQLHMNPRWQAALRLVAEYEESPPLPLDI
jgi:beta-N-acetylhexosaminidase